MKGYRLDRMLEATDGDRTLQVSAAWRSRNDVVVSLKVNKPIGKTWKNHEKPRQGRLLGRREGL